jgi:peptidoglycan/LPS O-acetylase OafA/YrhL
MMDTEVRANPAVSSNKSSTASKILPLTSLRFFAALWVVFFHTLLLAFGPQVTNVSTVSGRIMLLGYISVSFFFTLSGYILAVTYLPRAVSTRSFWWARFARVYPLFFVTLILGCPKYFLGEIKRLGAYAATGEVIDKLAGNIFMLQAWLPSLNKFDFPNWSLSVEAFFYLLFPFLLVVIAKPRIRFLAVMGVFTWLAGMSVVAAAIHARLADDILRFNPLFHLHSFVLGAILGVIQSRKRLSPRLAPLFLLAATACFVLAVHYYTHIPMSLMHDGLMAPAFVCLILAFGSGNEALDKLLSFRWLVVLGEASYGLYLIHIPMWDIWHSLRLERSVWGYGLYLASIIALSVLSFFYLETPLRRMLTKPANLLPYATAYWRKPRPQHG